MTHNSEMFEFRRLMFDMYTDIGSPWGEFEILTIVITIMICTSLTLTYQIVRASELP